MSRFTVIAAAVLLVLFGAAKAYASIGHFTSATFDTSTAPTTPLAVRHVGEGRATGLPESVDSAKNGSGGSANGQLNATFQEAGLGNNTGATYVLTSPIEYGEVGCVNGGGNLPSAANKSGPFSSSSQPQTFTSDNNGNVKATMSDPAAIDALLAGLNCGAGQTPTLLSVTFCSATLSDTTYGDTYNATGPFVWTNPTLNLKGGTVPVASCT